MITSAAFRDEIHAAFCAGRDYGLAEGQRMASAQLAADLLHRQACEMTGIAVRTARKRHGDSWATLIREQAEGVA